MTTTELGSRQPIGWICLWFFGACAVLAWSAGEPGPALGFGAFAVLGIVLVTSRADITIDGTGLTRRGRLGTHRIAWDEVVRVESDGVTLVLCGTSKRLPVAPRFWDPATAERARERFEHELAVRAIPRVDNPLASRAVTRGTRV